MKKYKLYWLDEKTKEENKELRKQLEQAKELLKKYNYKASCCGEFMKHWDIQNL